MVAFLRIAAGLALLQGIGHAAAVVRWAPMRGAREAAVVDAMKSQSFFFQGLARSYWDFFFTPVIFDVAITLCLMAALVAKSITPA